MNLSAVIALTVGIIAVVLPQLHGEFNLHLLLQPTAFCIVVIGTMCAAILNFNYMTVYTAFKSSLNIFRKSDNKSEKIVDEIIQIAHFARKNGLVALDGLLDKVSDNFLARGLQLAIDINNPQLIYDILSSEIEYEEEEDLIHSRVFEALGGYAPTFGIVGAVIGLIDVLKNLQEPEHLGIGIATAFVSTLYGVGIANLIFLPIAGNLKQKTRERILLKEIILQGVISISIQESPLIMEEKLLAYLKYHHKREGMRYA
ncbi:MotA/TolQ/ExbB proton channel family protein [bacterium]|nr:MotA/TolQ/ExbB proton channel family protein [bacterium]